MGATPGIFPLAFLDAPVNTTVTPIPGSGSAPMQVVANLGVRAASGIAWIDTSGDFIGVYLGPVGQEQLVCVIGGGLVGTLPVVIAARSRISIRSMTTSPITNGKLFCTFLGQGWGPM